MSRNKRGSVNSQTFALNLQKDLEKLRVLKTEAKVNAWKLSDATNSTGKGNAKDDEESRAIHSMLPPAPSEFKHIFGLQKSLHKVFESRVNKRSVQADDSVLKERRKTLVEEQQTTRIKQTNLIATVVRRAPCTPIVNEVETIDPVCLVQEGFTEPAVKQVSANDLCVKSEYLQDQQGSRRNIDEIIWNQISGNENVGVIQRFDSQLATHGVIVDPKSKPVSLGASRDNRNDLNEVDFDIKGSGASRDNHGAYHEKCPNSRDFPINQNIPNATRCRRDACHASPVDQWYPDNELNPEIDSDKYRKEILSSIEDEIHQEDLRWRKRHNEQNHLEENQRKTEELGGNNLDGDQFPEPSSQPQQSRPVFVNWNAELACIIAAKDEIRRNPNVDHLTEPSSHPHQSRPVFANWNAELACIIAASKDQQEVVYSTLAMGSASNIQPPRPVVECIETEQELFNPIATSTPKKTGKRIRTMYHLPSPIRPPVKEGNVLPEVIVDRFLISEVSSNLSSSEERDRSSILDERDRSSILDERDRSSILDERDRSSILDERDRSSILDERDRSSILDEREIPFISLREVVFIMYFLIILHCPLPYFLMVVCHVLLVLL